MVLAVITLALLGITLACFVFGTLWLAKYAFRIGTGPGIGVLLFPPYTFYFAFYQLEHERKDRPTALWMFGLVASVLLVVIFAAPLQGLLSGDISALAAPEPEAAPVQAAPEFDAPPTPEPAAAPAVAPTPDAVPGTDAAPTMGADAAPAVGAAPTPAAPAEAPLPTPASGAPAAVPAPGAAPVPIPAAPVPAPATP